MSVDPLAQSIHRRLLNVRDRTGEHANSLLVRFSIERLMYRFTLLGLADMFVVKGAVLYSVWSCGPRRATRDLDLLGIGDLSHTRVRRLFEDICTVAYSDDGLAFDRGSIRVDDIRDEQEYHGVRVRLHAYLGRARIPVQVDIGIGDSVLPEPVLVEFPTILHLPPPCVLTYHPTTVVAEKLNAMVTLGVLNSRMKDFYDVHAILTTMNLDRDLLSQAICSTFSRRNTPVPVELPVALTSDFLESGYKEIQWRAFLHRSGLDGCHLSLGEVVEVLRRELWPILDSLGGTTPCLPLPTP